MKKTMAFILTVLMIAALFTVAGNAAAKPTAEIKRGVPVVDGKIDEIWEFADELAIDRFVVQDKGDSKATGYAKMLWDDGVIYCLIVINDDTKSDQTEALHTEDCLEVFFDLDNKKTETYSENNQFRFLYDIVSPLGIRNPEHISESYADYLKLAGTEPSKTQYVYEFSLDEKIGINVKFNAGKEIGIDFSFDDNTKNDTTRTAIWTWNAEGKDANPASNPSVLGTVKLIDEEAYVEIIEEEPAAAEAPKTTPTAAKTADVFVLAVAALVASSAGIVVSKKRK